MTAPLAKVDALLAARVAPWLELLAPKAPAAAGQAQPVLNAPRVDNEVLLPARAGVHPQPSEAAHGGPAAAKGERAASSHTDLSAAARVIQGVLTDRRQGDAGPVRGAAPLWHATTRQAPAADALATVLAQRVSESGLFYESHLGQFAAGTRSLAQMQREPQAALLSRGEAAADDGAPAGPVRQGGQLLPMATPQAAAPAMSPAAASTPVVMAMATTTVQAAPDASASHEVADGMRPVPMDSASQQQQPVVARADSAASPAVHASRHADAASAAVPLPATAGDAPQPAAMAVHPQAGALVHQQLDLLASGMFRWSGEAWPGVPMQWTMVQEEGARHPADDADARQGSWSTTVSLELPRLGRIDLRLSLSGSSARAQLATPRPDSLMQLRAHRATLSQRMAAAGFELRSLQMDSELAAS